MVGPLIHPVHEKKVLEYIGIGQQEGSNKTPLGLHRIAEKIGAGWSDAYVFFKHEDSGTGPALARRFVTLRERSRPAAPVT